MYKNNRFLNENPGKNNTYKKIKRDMFVFGVHHSPSGFNINVKNKFSDINIENISAEDIDEYNGTD